ncbi:MAG: 4-hydroxybenzoate octaprenyltransferase [Micavibrio sp.]|nr:4-hydroxybenzoate octaprenyltransferase [Micavibrio sp.]
MSTDIQTEKLIFRTTAPRLHPYIKLARLDRPIGTWLLLLPGWWSIVLASGGIAGMGARGWSLMLLFAVGALLMRGAGCVVNDLWDRDLDAKVERTRTRPLPAGDVTVRQAFIFLALLLLPSFCILLTLGTTAIVLGVCSLALVGSYPLMKRVTWWPQAFLGLTFNWGALMGWAAVRGSLDKPALVLYAGGILWTLAYDTIYAHQDKEDDATVGIKSTALLFGQHSKRIVGAFFFAALTLFGVAKYFANPASTMTCWLLFPCVLHIMWQLHDWKMEDAASSLKIFRANRDFGLLVLLLCCF